MRHFISFVLIWALSALCAAAFWSGSVQDQIISQDDNMLGWYTRMVVDGNGVIHTIWNERVVNLPLQYEIHYSRSSDNGHTWSAMAGDIIISYSDGYSAETGGAIACDSQNHLYAVWTEDDPTIREVHYSISTDGGNTWSGQTGDHTLSLPGGGDALNPWVAVDGNDVIHVVWQQDYAGTIDEIYYSRSTDGGLTWSSQTAETIVSFPDGQAASEPMIAVGPNDELYVIWREADDSLTTYAVVNASISLDGGNTWSGTSADQPVTQPFRIILYPAMTVDANGYIHVVWKGTQDTASPFHYEIYHSRSTDSGLTWSGWTQEAMVSYYSPTEPSANIPRVAGDSQGNVIAVWDEDYGNGDNEIFVSTSTDGGQTWTGTTQEEIISFPDGHPGYRPYIVAGLDDTLHVTWNETTTTSYYQIHYSRGDAISGQPDVTITMTPMSPPIIIPPGGGSFDFTVALANNESTAQNFDAWILVQLPNQSWYGPVLGPINLTLSGGASISRLRTQGVPAGAPAGNYLYEGRVGSYPNLVWNSDNFPFTKSAVGDLGSSGSSAWENSGEAFENSGSVIPHSSSLNSSVSPNPFNPRTAISYQLSADSYVSLRVYDTAGRLVGTLAEGWREAGVHEVTFDGTDLASGVYLYRLRSGDLTATGKMLLLK